MQSLLHLDQDSFVVEVASNDGYLLKNFVEDRIPVLGVEPAKNVAETARENGVPTRCEFFGKQSAERHLEDRSLPPEMFQDPQISVSAVGRRTGTFSNHASSFQFLLPKIPNALDFGRAD